MHPLPLRLREEFPKIGSSYRDSLCYSSWKTLLKTELVICYICARSLSPVGVCYLVGGSVFECLQVSRLSESSRLPLKYLSSSGPSFLPSSPISESPRSTPCFIKVLYLCFIQLHHGSFQCTIKQGSCVGA